MLTRKYIEQKFDEIESKLRRLNQDIPLQREHAEHLKRLRKNYQIEYSKALARKELQVGDKLDTARVEGHNIQGKQRNRGFFEEGFYNF